MELKLRGLYSAMYARYCSTCNCQYSAGILYCPTCHGALSTSDSSRSESLQRATSDPQGLSQPVTKKEIKPVQFSALPAPRVKNTSKIKRKLFGGATGIKGQTPILAKRSVFTLLLFIGFFSYLIWNGSEHITHLIFANTSVETEIRIAEKSAHESIKASLDDTNPDSMLVKQLGKRLILALPASSPYRTHYNFHVIPSSQINAFALPGGSIFIYSGLLDVAERDNNNIAAILAHEIEHVEQRHGLYAVMRALGTGAIIGWTFGFSSDLPITLNNALINTHYSRQIELDADRLGNMLMKQAGFDPGAMPRMFRKMGNLEPAHLGWLSSHPSSKDRADIIENMH